MSKKKKIKRYALIKIGAITPILTGTKEEMERLYNSSTPAQKKVLKVEEVLD